MNKYDRLDEITKLVNKRGSVRTNEIVEDLNVSDMTVRRDLAELEEKGVLTKIHGGARSNSAFQYKEMSHQEKHTRFIEEKRFIAKNAVQKLAEEINHYSLTIITNCLPVFNILIKKQTLHFRVYLLGGEMRDLTEAFVGEMTNQLLSQLRFSKMFFSSNGVKDGLAMTSSIEEAYTQQIALSHSLEKYLLIDSSKIGKDDFSSFCELRELNAVLTDNNDLEKKEKIESYVEVIS